MEVTKERAPLNFQESTGESPRHPFCLLTGLVEVGESDSSDQRKYVSPKGKSRSIRAHPCARALTRRIREAVMHSDLSLQALHLAIG